ncbi:hypothetical protein CKO44_10325 [Rubrivivax gelatinosus]|uniref:Tetracyclin repressor-like C-terminal domain-containing protein n=1 Tax=Rubrivivax gelatinosus TaxID=28068 RepID=A0ABS1DZW8_RUBGE|nr:hypothetical protein [Rubrivivax gelatinosus]MBK1613864.1 hypothetical protein [Rubrivivax gelatinosus]MBK1715304.1 hypothetical protein [Rubrivivax gelatinosus]
MDGFLGEFEIWLAMVGLGSGSWIGYVLADSLNETMRSAAERAGVLKDRTEGGNAALAAPAADPADGIERAAAPVRSDIDALATGIIERYLDLWEHEPGEAAMETTVRAAMAISLSLQEHAATQQEAAKRRITCGIAPLLEIDNAALRAQLVNAQLLGTAVMRHIVKAEPLASMSVPQLVEALVPAVGRSLSEPMFRDDPAGRR